MAPVIVHQLVESKIEGTRRVTTRCGQVIRCPVPSSKLPDDVTAWGSRVTCKACRTY